MLDISGMHDISLLRRPPIGISWKTDKRIPGYQAAGIPPTVQQSSAAVYRQLGISEVGETARKIRSSTPGEASYNQPTQACNQYGAG